MIARGLRDLAVGLLGICGFTALASLAIGAAAALSPQRALSGGFLLVGALFFTAGAVVGLRDPSRARERRVARGDPETGAAGLASWTQAFHLSALLVGAGVLLVLVGILLHPTASL